MSSIYRAKYWGSRFLEKTIALNRFKRFRVRMDPVASILSHDSSLSPPPFEQPISLALGSLACSCWRFELLDASSVLLGQIHLANFLISLRDFLKRRDRTC